MSLIPVLDLGANPLYTLGGDQIFIVGPGAILANEWPLRAEPACHQVLTWRTDVQKHWDGTEVRTSKGIVPRQRIAYDYKLNEEERRYARAALYNDTDAAWKIPCWFEPYRTTGIAAIGGTTVEGAFVDHDLEDLQWIYIVADEADAVGEFRQLASVAGTTLTINGNWGDQYAAGALIYPAVLAYADDGQGMGLEYGLHPAGWGFEVKEHRLLAPNNHQKAISLDSASKYASITDAASAGAFDFGTTLTIAGYINRSDYTETVRGLLTRLPGSGNYAFGFELSNEELQLWLSENGTTVGLAATNNNTLSGLEDQDVHVAVVWDVGAGIDNAGRTRFFVNGVEETVKINQTPNVSTLYNSAADVVVGVDAEAPNAFNGSIADLRVWSVALTPAEVIDEMNSPAPVRTDGLVAHLEFDGDCTDAGGNGYDFTASGAPSYIESTAPALSLPQHEGKIVLDQQPHRPASESADRGISRLDFGGALSQIAGAARADIPRALSFTATSWPVWREWKRFLDSVAGRREAFYHATWLPDLELASQPGADATYLTIDDSPNFGDRWFDTGASHMDLQLETTAGVFYRRISSWSDNGDGTLKLILDQALPSAAGLTVSKISFLELVRLGSDTVEVTHAKQRTVALSTQVVQG